MTDTYNISIEDTRILLDIRLFPTVFLEYSFIPLDTCELSNTKVICGHRRRLGTQKEDRRKTSTRSQRSFKVGRGRATILRFPTLKCSFTFSLRRDKAWTRPRGQTRCPSPVAATSVRRAVRPAFAKGIRRNVRHAHRR